jgi:membrane protease YdiL (CAAX protease family)
MDLPINISSSFDFSWLRCAIPIQGVQRSDRKPMKGNAGRARSKPSRIILFELALVLAVTYALYFLLPPSVKGLVLFLPIAYILVERHIRDRSWKELGTVRQGFLKGIAATWYLFIIVAVVLQITIPWGAAFLWPAYLQHVLSRLPWSPTSGIAALLSFLLLTALSTFLEELVFRGLIQERLSWFFPQALALVAASVLFGIIHWTAGNPIVVLADVSAIILDGMFYGAIYVRSRSVLVSWIAHFFSDIVGLAMLLLLF